MNMRTGGTLLGVLAGVVLCSCAGNNEGDPVDTESPVTFCTGAEATLTAPDEAAGEVSLSFTLMHPDAQAAKVILEWSDDGENWSQVTATGSLGDRASSTGGVEHEVLWNTSVDLGTGEHEGISLRLRTSSACGWWPAQVVEDITVRNVETFVATCSVEMISLDGVQEGDVVLEFVARHPQSTSAWVELDWSMEGDDVWSSMEVEDTDCDGDSRPDGELSDLETSAEGVTHCVTWNSDAVINVEAGLTVRASCGVGQELQHTDEVALTIDNDLTPDPGEIIISELMITSDHPGGNYIEVHSLAGHTLDLNGIAVQRWNAGLEPTSAPSSRFDVSVPSGTLLIEPDGYLLMADSDDPADNGCLNPDLVLDAGFTLRGNSTLGLSAGGVLVAHVPFLYADGWFFQANQAMAVDPAAYRSPNWADISGWCGQLTTVNGCAPIMNPGVAGTPGEVNDSCAR